MEISSGFYFTAKLRIGYSHLVLVYVKFIAEGLNEFRGKI
jgi:hypothetical protein